MKREDYRNTPQFKEAVRRIWTKLIVYSLIVSALIGWFFHDLLAMLRSPMLKVTVGEFMGVFVVVYVTANLVLRWVSGEKQ